MQPRLAAADIFHVQHVPSGEALQTALGRLGYDAFRPGQLEAVQVLFDVGRLLLVAPTGGGKSLSYQLPATLLSGTTLVVSPLIALMHDQVRALSERGVAATFLASTLQPDELRSRMAAIAAGKYTLVYVAPERLAFGGFRSLVRDIRCPLVAVDEAHCISEWGHDFRPEYMQIGELIAQLPRARVLACTATATPVVRDEIIGRLGLPASTPQLLRGFARPNLVLRAREVDGRQIAQAAVDDLLREALGGPERHRGTAIVYAATRRRAEQEAHRLADRGYAADCYHAGLPPAQRSEVQARFSRGELSIVAATNAFGMGIDRGDVRAVAHLSPPASIEAYYQEVGRAGRDGQPAIGLLLCSPADMALRRRLLGMGSGEGRQPDSRVVEHKWQMFLELMRLLEGDVCRHDAILRYFGDEAETLSGCGRCDVCVRSVASRAMDAEAAELLIRKALSGVARVHGQMGFNAAVGLLRGRTDARLTRAGLTQRSTFGILRQHSQAFVQLLLRRCVTAGLVTFTADERPLVALTAEGIAVMRGGATSGVTLPQEGTVRSTERAPGVGGSGAQTPARAGRLPAPEMTGATEQAFAALREHRLNVARTQGVPPYVVATDRSLRELALQRPRTLDDLLAVHGFGPAKVERYGQGLLDALRQLE